MVKTWGKEVSVQPRMLDTELVGPDWTVLCCPVCGYSNTHVSEAYTRLGNDEYEGGRPYTGTVAKGVAGFRRDGLVVEIWGECGHTFQFILQQHKGFTFVLYRVALYDGEELPTEHEP